MSYIQIRKILKTPTLICLMLVSTVAIPQTMQINTSNQDYEVTNLFSDVDDFEFTITVADSSSGGGLVNPLENISLLLTSFLLVKFSCNYKNRTPASEKFRYFLHLTASQVA